MIKLFAMECNSNVAVAINGRKRENFEAGAKVLVTRDEYLTLLRLGFKLLGEAEVTYDDIAKLVVSPESKVVETQKAQKASKKAEKAAEKVEEVVETAETAVETSEEAGQ